MSNKRPKYVDRLYRWIYSFVRGGAGAKARHELRYWKARKSEEGTLSYGHYEYFFTIHFGLTRDFYKGKGILDVGCGPRGSLEWADMTAERLGIDPLANEYLKLGAKGHRMRYVPACSEEMPFPDGYFDVVSSFNSLDHVDNLDRTIEEITRVTAPGGLFLFLADVNHDPTTCEPLSFGWDVTEKFLPRFAMLEERHYEKSAGGIYENILADIPYDHSNGTQRPGIVSVRFIKMEKYDA